MTQSWNFWAKSSQKLSEDFSQCYKHIIFGKVWLLEKMVMYRYWPMTGDIHLSNLIPTCSSTVTLLAWQSLKRPCWDGFVFIWFTYLCWLEWENRERRKWDLKIWFGLNRIRAWGKKKIAYSLLTVWYCKQRCCPRPKLLTLSLSGEVVGHSG